MPFQNSTLAPPVLSILYEATNSAKIDITGYAISKSKVQIFIDDQFKKEIISEDDGSFLVKDIELVLGINNIYGKTVDPDTISLPSKTIRVIYDNEKPPLEISEPDDGKTIEGEKRVTVSGKTEPNSKVFITNTQVIVDSEGKFSTIVNLNEGENLITIRALDQAANITETERKVLTK